VDLAAVKILLMHLVATAEEGTARRGRQGQSLERGGSFRRGGNSDS
jgi:hypothetical protein